LFPAAGQVPLCGPRRATGKRVDPAPGLGVISTTRAKDDLVRDVFSLISMLIVVWIVVEIFRRIRRTNETWRDWLPIIVLCVLTIIFYVSVFIDQQVDFMNASDVSSTVRLISELMLVIFVKFFQNRINQ
jgi:hypothetical protein